LRNSLSVMEVRLTGNEGLPLDSVVVVRAGQVSRQARLGTASSLGLEFPLLPEQAERLSVELLQPLSGSCVALKPEVESYSVSLPDEELSTSSSRRLQLRIRDSLGLGLSGDSAGQSLPGESRSDTAGSQPQPQEGQPDSFAPDALAKLLEGLENAAEASSYFQEHGIVPQLQDMLKSVAQERPENPFSLMAQHARRLLSGSGVAKQSRPERRAVLRHRLSSAPLDYSPSNSESAASGEQQAHGKAAAGRPYCWSVAAASRATSVAPSDLPESASAASLPGKVSDELICTARSRSLELRLRARRDLLGAWSSGTLASILMVQASSDSVSAAPAASDSVSRALAASDSISRAPAVTDSVSMAPAASNRVSREAAVSDSVSVAPAASGSLAPAATNSVSRVPAALDSVSGAPAASDSVSQLPAASVSVSTAPAASDSVLTAPATADSVSKAPAASDSVLTAPAAGETVLMAPAASEAVEDSVVAGAEASREDLERQKQLVRGTLVAGWKSGELTLAMEKAMDVTSEDLPAEASTISTPIERRIPEPPAIAAPKSRPSSTRFRAVTVGAGPSSQQAAVASGHRKPLQSLLVPLIEEMAVRAERRRLASATDELQEIRQLERPALGTRYLQIVADFTDLQKDRECLRQSLLRVLENFGNHSGICFESSETAAFKAEVAPAATGNASAVPVG